MTTTPSLMKALRELLDAHPVYRGHPSGAPNSAARAAQERAIKAEDVVRAALAAHAKQAEPQAVAVKPLRWPPECPRGQRVYGRGITLKYCIAHYGGDSEDTVYRWAIERAPWSEPYKTYEAAKADAQADYEQRILSALAVVPPAKPAEPDAGHVHPDTDRADRAEAREAALRKRLAQEIYASNGGAGDLFAQNADTVDIYREAAQAVTSAATALSQKDHQP